MNLDMWLKLNDTNGNSDLIDMRDKSIPYVVNDYVKSL